MAMMGIPRFMASARACLSAAGSVTTSTSGSMKLGLMGLVRVPGTKRPAKAGAPMALENSLAGRCPYCLAEATRILLGSNPARKWAAALILSSVFLTFRT